MIEYSIAKKNIKPGDASSDKKVYATAQCKGTLTAKQIAEHISSHGSKYNRADILGVLYSVAQCMEEFLLDGYQVELYEFGTFYPVIHSEGAESLSEFKKENITNLAVNWRRSKRFKRLFKKAKFGFTVTRAAQALMLKESKKAIRDALAASNVARDEGDVIN